MTIVFYGSVQDQVGGEKTIEHQHCENVRALIDALGSRFGEECREYLLGDDTCFLLVNGKAIMATGGLNTPLTPEDKVEILPVAEAG